MNFKGKDVVSIRDLSREDIDQVLDLSERMIPYAKGEIFTKALDGRILANLFFEPSTRTHMSFSTAMSRLGGRTMEMAHPSMMSVAKGETLTDTIRMVESYSDVIVLRHPHEGSARLAAHFSSKPVINAGDGAGQHPTQTLLDLFTIRREFKKIEDVKVALVGDLKYGRTVHSLAEALTMFGAEVTFVAPANLQMPRETVRQVEKLGGKPKLTSRLEDVIKEVDVLYITRIQKERFPDPQEYERVKDAYVIDNSSIEGIEDKAIIMHPLPRVTEINPEIDRTRHARYFEQARNGIPVRMTLLSLVSGVDF